MDAVKNDVKRLVKIELAAANKKFRMFAGPHEGAGIIQEEVVEAAKEMNGLRQELNAMWMNVYSNNPQISTKGVYDRAVALAVEAIQTAAMARKFERSQRRHWPGQRIRTMVKKNDAPTEIETITLTMSRPVAEAVQAACEWYLRLHMGQFWDLAEDLCFAKFYSDAENNAFQSEEQRKNAFNVAIGRRNTMLLEMERLYSRCVLPAPTSDVMKVPYRAEQVWLAIRHALAWHDKPEGDPWNVCFDKPLNRSDQPQPVVKLNEKQEAKK